MFLKTDTSQANQHFSAVPSVSKPRNAFSIAESHKTTINFDYLYPIFQKLIMPGDSLAITHAMIARLTTQVSVLHDDLYFDMHAWYVPLRLVHTNFNRLYWNSKETGPSQDNSALTTPSIPSGIDGTSITGIASKTLYDYFGYPTKVRNTVAGQYATNYLPRCYNLIFREHYMDQNLQTPPVVDLGDAEDTLANYVLLKRGRRYDKFSSALTSLQKGTAVSLPLGTTAPVLSNNNQLKMMNTATGVDRLMGFTNEAGSRLWIASGVNDTGATKWGTESGLYANLAGATAATINDFRRSVAIQQLLEADARGGTRAIEASQNRFGVSPDDKTINRPEYLGGATFSFDGKIVPQTSATAGSSYQGGLTQFSETQNQFNVAHSFTEWGYMIILISARSNITYQQGLQRELSYRTRYDFYQPEFANIGEVAMLQQEIYCGGVAADKSVVWGYNEYGYEMRFSENRVSGEFRSNYATPKDYKHCAELYGSAPTLSASWVQSSTRINSNLTVSTGTADPIEISALTQGKIARVMPMYSIPGLTRI